MPWVYVIQPGRHSPGLLSARRENHVKRLEILFGCQILLLVAIAGAHGASYQIRELGVFAEGSAGLPCVGWANGINSSGRIVGVVYDSGVSYAAASNDQGDLVLLEEGLLLGVNGLGQAAGCAGSAAVWDAAGNVTHLFLPSGASFSQARAINDSGQAVGECWMGTTDVHNYALLWSAAGDPTSICEGSGNSINSSGSVAGSTNDSGGARRAFLWTTSGGIAQLAGGLSSEANALNNYGLVAGAVTDAAGTWACQWDASGSLTLLDNLPGSMSSVAYGINNSGVIVGSCDTPQGTFAVLWQPDGSITSLGEPTGHASSAAYALNDFGQIVGCSVDASTSPHPVVWELVPEPASVLALLVGLVGLLPRLRRR